MRQKLAREPFAEKSAKWPSSFDWPKLFRGVRTANRRSSPFSEAGGISPAGLAAEREAELNGG